MRPCSAMNFVVAAARRTSSRRRVRAPGVGVDPPRAARHVHQQGRRLPVRRRRRDDACSASGSCASACRCAEPPPDDRASRSTSWSRARSRRGACRRKAISRLVPLRRRRSSSSSGSSTSSASSRCRSRTRHSTSSGWSSRPGGLRGDREPLRDALALALITFVATHVEGIRFNGVVRYFKSWVPQGVPGRCSS